MADLECAARRVGPPRVDLGHRVAADEQDVDPAFSPDGKSILFTSTRGGTTGVWKMSRTGDKPERICDGDQAEWSPDGRAIVLRRNEQLFTRELGSGQEKRISPKDWPHCSGPAWSPDGKWIAFACRWDAGNARVSRSRRRRRAEDRVRQARGLRTPLVAGRETTGL